MKADGTFDVPSHVLKSVMNGQRWPGGGDRYYEGIRVPTLIIHGREDRLVTVDDDREMAEVEAALNLFSSTIHRLFFYSTMLRISISH